MPGFEPIRFRHVVLTDPYWTAWQQAFRDRGIPHQWRMVEETGRMEAIRRAARRDPNDRGEGTHQFADSDVHKLIEATAYLQAEPARLEDAIGWLLRAQEEDGYLNSHFQLARPGDRWKNLAMMHELYCGGHMIEAAVALAEMDDDRLLAGAERFATLVEAHFGAEDRDAIPGHQEIELALVRLAERGEPKHREMARRFVERRGRRPSRFERELADPKALAMAPYMSELLTRQGRYSGEYLQDHLPLEEQTEAVGHSVRATYLYAGARRAFAVGERPALDRALETIWDKLVERRMYVTGGIGASSDNEGFTEDFDLPNETAYAETCAAIGFALWSFEMAKSTGEAKYMDLVERAAYNGILAGVSLNTTAYFYTNPLASAGSHRRKPWFECACCPPNVARFIGQIQRFAVGASKDTVWINLPIGVDAHFSVGGRFTSVSIRTSTALGHDRYGVRFDEGPPRAVTVKLRVPSWAKRVVASVAGETFEAESGYLSITRKWADADEIVVEQIQGSHVVECDPRVAANRGKLALRYGPRLLCVEEASAGVAPEVVRVTKSTKVHQVAANGRSFEYETDGDETRLIPYAQWANAEPSKMAVWLNER